MLKVDSPEASSNEKEVKGLKERVGVPTMAGLQSSLIDYAVGLGGGVIYSLSQALTGSGLIGGLIGAGVAGATIKGARGTAIATILGFQSIVGSIGQAAAASPDSGDDTM